MSPFWALFLSNPARLTACFFNIPDINFKGEIECRKKTQKQG